MHSGACKRVRLCDDTFCAIVHLSIFFRQICHVLAVCWVSNQDVDTRGFWIVWYIKAEILLVETKMGAKRAYCRLRCERAEWLVRWCKDNTIDLFLWKVQSFRLWSVGCWFYDCGVRSCSTMSNEVRLNWSTTLRLTVVHTQVVVSGFLDSSIEFLDLSFEAQLILSDMVCRKVNGFGQCCQLDEWMVLLSCETRSLAPRSFDPQDEFNFHADIEIRHLRMRQFQTILVNPSNLISARKISEEGPFSLW